MFIRNPRPVFHTLVGVFFEGFADLFLLEILQVKASSVLPLPKFLPPLCVTSKTWHIHEVICCGCSSASFESFLNTFLSLREVMEKETKLYISYYEVVVPRKSCEFRNMIQIDMCNSLCHPFLPTIPYNSP